MKLLLDMNLPSAWCGRFAQQGHDAVHWSACGNIRATDHEIMEWARSDGRAVITHDLDFGSILAATNATGPSVVLIRTAAVTGAELESAVLAVLASCADELAAGAIVTLEAAGRRVRVLPLGD